MQDVKDIVVKHKELRGKIDAIIQEVKQLPPTRETSLTITKLQEGVMWLGMGLKMIHDENPDFWEKAGNPDPYVGSKNPTTGAHIGPTADGLKL